MDGNLPLTTRPERTCLKVGRRQARPEKNYTRPNPDRPFYPTFSHAPQTTVNSLQDNFLKKPLPRKNRATPAGKTFPTMNCCPAVGCPAGHEGRYDLQWRMRSACIQQRGLAGDWSIFRRKDLSCEKALPENMDLSPRPRGPSLRPGRRRAGPFFGRGFSCRTRLHAVEWTSQPADACGRPQGTAVASVKATRHARWNSSRLMRSATVWPCS